MSVDMKRRELEMSYEGPTHITGSAGGSTQLTPSQLCVMVVPPSSSTHTIKLPNVGEAQGRIYSVISNGNDTGTISIAGNGSEYPAFTATGALTAAGDRAAFYCDGVSWHQINDVST